MARVCCLWAFPLRSGSLSGGACRHRRRRRDCLQAATRAARLHGSMARLRRGIRCRRERGTEQEAAIATPVNVVVLLPFLVQNQHSCRLTSSAFGSAQLSLILVCLFYTSARCPQAADISGFECQAEYRTYVCKMLDTCHGAWQGQSVSSPDGCKVVETPRPLVLSLSKDG